MSDCSTLIRSVGMPRSRTRLCVRRLRLLSLRARAASHHDRAVVLHRDGAELRPPAGHLDVDGDADAELHAVAPLATGPLLAPQIAVPGKTERRVQGQRILTRVVDGLRRRFS